MSNYKSRKMLGVEIIVVRLWGEIVGDLLLYSKLMHPLVLNNNEVKTSNLNTFVSGLNLKKARVHCKCFFILTCG